MLDENMDSKLQISQNLLLQSGKTFSFFLSAQKLIQEITLLKLLPQSWTV